MLLCESNKSIRLLHQVNLYWSKNSFVALISPLWSRTICRWTICRWAICRWAMNNLSPTICGWTILALAPFIRRQYLPVEPFFMVPIYRKWIDYNYRTPMMVCRRVQIPETKKIVPMSSLLMTLSLSPMHKCFDMTRGFVTVAPNIIK